MSAGSGIAHSEHNAEDEETRIFQLWIEPRSSGGEPRWGAKPFPKDSQSGNWTILASGLGDNDDALMIRADAQVAGISLKAGEIAHWSLAFGLSSPLITASETLYCDLHLEAGAKLKIGANTEERAIYTVGGTLEIGDASFEPGQLIILSSSEPCIVTAASNARFVLIGGAAMEGPRYLWWNFVSLRPERIEQAKEDWRMGRFGTVPGDAQVSANEELAKVRLCPR